MRGHGCTPLEFYLCEEGWTVSINELHFSVVMDTKGIMSQFI